MREFVPNKLNQQILTDEDAALGEEAWGCYQPE
jgi:hypothetical protein